MKTAKFILFFIVLFIGLNLSAQDMTDVRIFINPGHGGYDSDDRNVVIPPFTQGDRNGFWESQSNLDKGTYLNEMLSTRNATTMMSRTQNRTEDDLPLSTIVRMANEFNSDFMLSIHSNAGNTARSAVLMLYAGVSPGDTQVYPTPTPYSEESRLISTEIAINLYSNQATSWSSSYSVQGDKTFARVAMGWSDGYGVLRGLTVPGVISEGSHHDYLPETYRLMNLEYKWLEAWHFLKSFATYFKSATISTGNIAGVVKDKFLKDERAYNKIPGTKDEFVSIEGATVTLLPNNVTYTTDNLNNGFYLFKDLEPGNYTVITEHPLYHPDTAQVTVSANTVSYNNVQINKIRNTPPQVVEYSPNVALTDSVLNGSVIRFRFNWDIDPASAQQAFSIDPAVEGTFVFKEANYVMEFVPSKPLDKSTLYTVTLDTTLRHQDGLNMEEDFTFQFRTTNRNELKIIASYPLSNETNIDYKAPVFTFIFDRELVTTELIQGIQVYDKNGNQLVKNMRSLRHNTVAAPYGSTSFTVGQDLVPGEQYVVKLARGIKDVDGLFLPDTLEIPFTASDERVIDKTVIENFEVASKITVSTSESLQLTSASVLRPTTPKLFGSYSYNFKYNFSGKQGGEVVYRVAEPTLTVRSDSTIGLHVYGDLSGNELYLMLQSANDTKEVKLDSLHYGGWKFVEAPLSDLIAETDYQFVGFKVKQTNAPISNVGNFFVDNMLLYTSTPTGIPSTEANKGVVVYPNPSSDVIYVKLPFEAEVQRLTLYSLNGQLVRETNVDHMSVVDLAKGTYILKINYKNEELSLPVIVK